MNTFLKLAFCAVTAGVSLSSPVFANTVVVNQTLDLTQPMIASPFFTAAWQDTPAFNGGFNVAIAEGDIFDFTIDFLGTQTLTLNNPTFIWAFSYADIDSEVNGTGTLSLLDAGGLPFLTSDTITDTEGDIHFGQGFYDTDFTGGLPASLTFSGVHYVGTLNDYIVAGVTTRNYDHAGFSVIADNAVVNAVPVPASWVLMLSGISFFLSMRRKQA